LNDLNLEFFMPVCKTIKQLPHDLKVQGPTCSILVDKKYNQKWASSRQAIRRNSGLVSLSFLLFVLHEKLNPYLTQQRVKKREKVEI